MYPTYSKSQNETIFLFEIDEQQLQIACFLLSAFQFHFEHNANYFPQFSFQMDISSDPHISKDTYVGGKILGDMKYPGHESFIKFVQVFCVKASPIFQSFRITLFTNDFHNVFDGHFVFIFK